MTTDKRLEEIRQNYCSCEQDKQCYTCAMFDELSPAIKSHILSVVDKCETVAEVKKAIGELCLVKVRNH